MSLWKHTMTGLILSPHLSLALLGGPALAQPVWPPPYAAIEVRSEHVAAVTMTGLNDDGVAAGSLSSPNLAFMWHRGRYLLLEGLNPDFLAIASDINDRGWVVGYSADFSPANVPTLWIDGQPRSLGTLGGERGEATAINELGHVVGRAENIEGHSRAFLWRDGEMSDLGTLGGLGSWAWGMNNTGQVVGHSFDPNLIGQRGFLWDDGTMIDIGTLPDGGECRGLDINDLGQVVGRCQDAAGDTHAILWENGQMRSIHDARLGALSRAEAINNRSEVVGYTLPDHESLITRAFIWDADNGMRDLQDLCPPNMVPKRWNAGEINEHGQIAVSAQRGNPFNGGRFVSLFLTPVNPTMIMSEPTPGSAGIENTLTVTHAAPGSTVRFYYSRHGGGAIIPGCATRVNALQLAQPQLIGTAMADQNGVAAIARTVPTIAQGQTILFQAVVQNECAISQLVMYRFE